jgi:hypothetical protein
VINSRDFDLAKFKIFVRNILIRNNKNSRNQLLKVLNDGLLKILIRNLIDNQFDLNTVSKISYFHSNGFLKILLIDERPEFSVRLHLWPQGAFEDCHIHDHPWHMTGVVLGGSYNWELFQVNTSLAENFNVSNLYECSYLNNYEGHLFSFKNQVHVLKKDQLSLSKGSFFELNSESYHKIVKFTDKSADSIVITGPSNGVIANVISKEGLMCNSVIFNSPVNCSFLKEMLILFLDRY